MLDHIVRIRHEQARKGLLVLVAPWFLRRGHALPMAVLRAAWRGEFVR